MLLLAAAWELMHALSATCSSWLGWVDAESVTLALTFGIVHSTTFWLLVTMFELLVHSSRVPVLFQALISVT
jgi:hypothetical protein